MARRARDTVHRLLGVGIGCDQSLGIPESQIDLGLARDRADDRYCRESNHAVIGRAAIFDWVVSARLKPLKANPDFRPEQLESGIHLAGFENCKSDLDNDNPFHPRIPKPMLGLMPTDYTGQTHRPITQADFTGQIRTGPQAAGPRNGVKEIGCSGFLLSYLKA
jgi:hypothetical protein